MAGNTIGKSATRLLSVLLLFFVAETIVSAQEKIKIDYGPKAGPNVSVLRGIRPFEGMRKPVVGICAGGFFNVRALKSRFQFEMDLLFTMRGNKADYLNLNSEQDETKSINVSYLEVPILLKYLIGNGKSMRASLFAGPAYAGILRATYNNGNIKNRITNDIKRDDLGIIAGAGLTWFYLDRWYFLDVRYFHGFINTSDLITKNMDVFNPNLPREITELDPFKKEIANYYNSTLSVTFGVSLSRQVNFIR